MGHRNRVRGAGHLRCEQIGNRRRDGSRLVQHRAVAHPVEVGAFGRVKQVDRRDPLGGVGGHGLQHPPQSIGESLDGLGVKNVGPVFDKATDAGGLPRQGPAFCQRERQIDSGSVSRNRDLGHLQVPQRDSDLIAHLAGQVMPHQHHLN